MRRNNSKIPIVIASSTAGGAKQSQAEIKRPLFKSSFKRWMRIVAFIGATVFLSAQASWAKRDRNDYTDFSKLFKKPSTSSLLISAGITVASIFGGSYLNAAFGSLSGGSSVWGGAMASGLAGGISGYLTGGTKGALYGGLGGALGGGIGGYYSTQGINTWHTGIQAGIGGGLGAGLGTYMATGKFSSVIGSGLAGGMAGYYGARSAFDYRYNQNRMGFFQTLKNTPTNFSKFIHDWGVGAMSSQVGKMAVNIGVRELHLKPGTAQILGYAASGGVSGAVAASESPGLYKTQDTGWWNNRSPLLRGALMGTAKGALTGEFTVLAYDTLKDTKYYQRNPALVNQFINLGGGLAGDSLFRAGAGGLGISTSLKSGPLSQSGVLGGLKSSWHDNRYSLVSNSIGLGVEALAGPKFGYSRILGNAIGRVAAEQFADKPDWVDALSKSFLSGGISMMLGAAGGKFDPRTGKNALGLTNTEFAGIEYLATRMFFGGEPLSNLYSFGDKTSAGYLGRLADFGGYANYKANADGLMKGTGMSWKQLVKQGKTDDLLPSFTNSWDRFTADTLHYGAVSNILGAVEGKAGGLVGHFSEKSSVTKGADGATSTPYVKGIEQTYNPETGKYIISDYSNPGYYRYVDRIDMGEITVNGNTYQRSLERGNDNFRDKNGQVIWYTSEKDENGNNMFKTTQDANMGYRAIPNPEIKTSLLNPATQPGAEIGPNMAGLSSQKPLPTLEMREIEKPSMQEIYKMNNPPVQPKTPVVTIPQEKTPQIDKALQERIVDLSDAPGLRPLSLPESAGSIPGFHAAYNPETNRYDVKYGGVTASVDIVEDKTNGKTRQMSKGNTYFYQPEDTRPFVTYGSKENKISYRDDHAGEAAKITRPSTTNKYPEGAFGIYESNGGTFPPTAWQPGGRSQPSTEPNQSLSEQQKYNLGYIPSSAQQEGPQKLAERLKELKEQKPNTEAAFNWDELTQSERFKEIAMNTKIGSEKETGGIGPQQGTGTTGDSDTAGKSPSTILQKIDNGIESLSKIAMEDPLDPNGKIRSNIKSFSDAVMGAIGYPATDSIKIDLKKDTTDWNAEQNRVNQMAPEEKQEKLKAFEQSFPFLKSSESSNPTSIEQSVVNPPATGIKETVKGYIEKAWEIAKDNIPNPANVVPFLGVNPKQNVEN